MSNPSQNTALLILATPVLVLGLAAGNADADTIYVCWDGSGDYLTIQEGIDAAQDLDEVVVCDGTYTGDGNRDLDFHGKAITVRSASGDPDLCIIDCEGSDSDPHRGFYLHSGETAVVDGFTITNGYTSDDGGGIYCEGVQVTITNCTITANSASDQYGDGGGVSCRDASLTITDCTISSNAADSSGGGVYCEYAQATITDCTISSNEALVGGGVYCENAQATITNCTISSNEASSGGGFGCFGGGATITNCTITGNSAEGGGGGIDCYYAFEPTTISNCTITGNFALDIAGGVYCTFPDTTVSNCTISGNTAGDEGGGVSCGSSVITDCTIADNWASGEHAVGGGVYCRHGAGTVANCTISGNSAEGGGGVYCDSDPTISNCTISDNEASYGGGVYCDSGSPTITNCTIADNAADGDNGGGIRFTWGAVSSVVTNCLITGNTAAGSGGGLSCDWLVTAEPTLTNCTFAHNAAAEYGGAVYCCGDLMAIDLSMTNCILWADLAAEGAEIALVGDATHTVSYSDVQGGEAQVYVGGGSELIWGEGNIDADPLFVDPDNGDYRLSAGSPCIDAADNEAVPPDELDLDGDGDTEEPIPFDLDGNPRFIDDPETEDTGNPDPDYPELPIVDMGAYEFQIPGDLNGDGCVDQADLGILLADWGCTGGECPGDCDGDGDTDQADLGILLAHWGEGCP